MTITLTKKYKTRAGLAVRLLETNLKVSGPDRDPIVGIVTNPGGDEQAITWKSDGSYHGRGVVHRLDLIEELPEFVSFHNVYPATRLLGCAYTSLADAQAGAAADSLGVLKVIRKGTSVAIEFLSATPAASTSEF